MITDDEKGMTTQITPFGNPNVSIPWAIFLISCEKLSSFLPSLWDSYIYKWLGSVATVKHICVEKSTTVASCSITLHDRFGVLVGDETLIPVRGGNRVMVMDLQHWVFERSIPVI